MILKGWIRCWHLESSGRMHYENTQAILEGILHSRQHLFGNCRVIVITINWGSIRLRTAGFLKGDRATTILVPIIVLVPYAKEVVRLCVVPEGCYHGWRASCGY